MSNGNIKLNEEIDGVIEKLGKVVGSYEAPKITIDGLDEGKVAKHFVRSVQRSQDGVNQTFMRLDSMLREIADAISLSVADHRATEEEINEILYRLLKELEDNPFGSGPGRGN